MPVDVNRFGAKSSSLVIGKRSEARGFCPTGPGGGIDNSCSSKQGGGRADYAVGDVVKRRDVSVGQTISVQKYGQTTVHNGVVTAVNHSDKASDITIKDANGNEKTIRIRDLAKIREANLGDADAPAGDAKPKREPKAGKSGKLGDVPPKPTTNGKRDRDAYSQAVKDYCKSAGVDVKEAIGARGTTIDSMHEVASGIKRLQDAGVELPSRVVLTNRQPLGKRLGGIMGYYAGGQQTIFVNNRMPSGEPDASIRNGWISGSAASAAGTVIVHETAHMLHDRAIGSTEFNRLPRPPKGGGSSLSFRDLSTASQVSRYATTCPVEFVAETFSGHTSGRRYSQEVYDLYDRYGGPKLPGRKGGKKSSKPFVR